MPKGPGRTPVSLSNLERVKRAIEEFSLLERGERVLVGLSGGADSVYCTLALLSLGYDVVAAHINHGLRETSERDEMFVREMCEHLKIPLEVERLGMEWGSAVEERARALRYEALRRIVRRVGARRICLAHTLSDAYETALFNLSRGTGTFGLVLPPESGPFVRPLILLWRDEVREALKEAEVPWIEDESNYDPRFARNFIRLKVLPRMLRIFPDLPKRFLRTYRLLHAERRFIKDSVDAYESRRVMRYAGITFILKDEEYLTARVLSRRLNVEVEKAIRAIGMEGGRRFVLRGRTVSSYAKFVAIYGSPPKIETQQRRFVWEHLNLRLVGEDLRGVAVRARRRGERVGGRKLKELYDRYGIPAILRDVHPVVEREGRVVWVPGIYGNTGGLRFSKVCDALPSLFDVYEFLGIRLRQAKDSSTNF
ncbi:MAG: tRNA lysidine(34) synthetase TilS [Thermotogae bacterium]|nr:tRNA lysidine(34) synthetase TilS [Thermotogota bacterium]